MSAVEFRAVVHKEKSDSLPSNNRIIIALPERVVKEKFEKFATPGRAWD